MTTYRIIIEIFLLCNRTNLIIDEKGVIVNIPNVSIFSNDIISNKRQMVIINRKFNKSHHFGAAPENYSEVGKEIYAYLKKLGISQCRFAEEFGISPSYLSHIMHGQYDAGPQIPKILNYLKEKSKKMA